MISHVEPSRQLIAGRGGPGDGAMALPEIPLLDVGADWPTATLEAQLGRAHALLNESGARFPRLALGIADALSRRWLARWHEPYLAEIDRISALGGEINRYFLVPT